VWGEKDKVRIRLGQGTAKVREAWGRLGTYPGTYLVPTPVPRAWQRSRSATSSKPLPLPVIARTLASARAFRLPMSWYARP
jgi:hypothetical protein